jgi:hypothetical protein
MGSTTPEVDSSLLSAIGTGQYGNNFITGRIKTTIIKILLENSENHYQWKVEFVNLMVMFKNFSFEVQISETSIHFKVSHNLINFNKR